MKMKKKKILFYALLSAVIMLFAGCVPAVIRTVGEAADEPDVSVSENEDQNTKPAEEIPESDGEHTGSTEEIPESDGEYTGSTEEEPESAEPTEGPEEEYPPNAYDAKLFVHDGDRLTYNDPAYHTCVGIDVSSHQGVIDWQQVKDDGIEFVFVRIGYRGYGEQGSLVQDKYGLENIDAAHEAGLAVGAYFFSQAVNEDEAAEEAAFAMAILEGRDLELPLVYDPETIKYDSARTDLVPGEQFTKNAVVFCEAVRAGGYEPMIYSNLRWQYLMFDMSRLTAYPFWYADYEGVPLTPYHFEFWQYSDSGTVAGIDGNVDMDLWMRS